MAHAFLAASAAPVWGFCSGSVYAAQSAPDCETEDTRNGDAAHWVCSESLLAWKLGGTGDTAQYIGQAAPNGVIIEVEHAQCAAVHVEDVIAVASNIPGGREALMVEARVHMPRIHPTDNWGTLDAGLVTPAAVYLWDYKHGFGGVEAVGNLQAVDYLEGVREAFNITDDRPCIVRIVQPRNYRAETPIREWVTSMRSIGPMVAQLQHKAAEVFACPSLTSGPHCKHCEARIRCEARREANYNLIDLAGLPIAFDTMAGADLAAEREILTQGAELIKKCIDALEDEIKHRVSSGDVSTGLTLESVPGRTSWSITPQQAIAAAALCGVDISRPHCDTPAQARAKVPSKDRAAFNAAIKHVTKTKTTTKLVNQADTIAARVFGKR